MQKISTFSQDSIVCFIANFSCRSDHLTKENESSIINLEQVVYAVGAILAQCRLAVNSGEKNEHWHALV